MSHTPRLSRRSFLVNSAVAAGTLAGAGALLDACGTSNNGTTTLSIMYDDGAELSKKYGPLYHQQFPKVQIKVLQPDTTRLNASFAAGDPPDIVRVTSTDVPGFAARGLATDLTPYINRSTLIKPSDLASINDSFRWDGKSVGQGSYYGIDKDWSIDTQFWYNKKLFDQAGVAHPDPAKPLTYDEMLAIAKKVTVRQGSKIQVYGLSTAWEFGFTYGEIVGMLAQTGTSLFNADFSQADFTQPEVKKILQWFVDWAQARVGPSPLDVGDNAFGLFNADRLAMVTFGYWFGGGYVGTQPNGFGDHTGMGVTPQWGTNRVSASTGSTGVFIPTASKNKDAAWAFIEWFLTNQPATDHFVTNGFGLPPLTHFLAGLPKSQSWQQDALNAVQADLPTVTTLKFSPYASTSAISTAIQNALTPVIKGQGTLDAAATQMNSSVNLLLSQGKSLFG